MPANANNNEEDFNGLDEINLDSDDFSLEDINLDDIELDSEKSIDEISDEIDMSLEDDISNDAPLSDENDDLDIKKDLGLDDELSLSIDEDLDLDSSDIDVNLLQTDMPAAGGNESSDDEFGVALKSGPETIYDQSGISFDDDLIDDVYQEENITTDKITNFEFEDKTDELINSDDEIYLKSDIDEKTEDDILDDEFNADIENISINNNSSLVSDEELSRLTMDDSNNSVTKATLADEEIILEGEDTDNIEDEKIKIDGEDINLDDFDLNITLDEDTMDVNEIKNDSDMEVSDVTIDSINFDKDIDDDIKLDADEELPDETLDINYTDKNEDIELDTLDSDINFEDDSIKLDTEEIDLNTDIEDFSSETEENETDFDLNELNLQTDFDDTTEPSEDYDLNNIGKAAIEEKDNNLDEEISVTERENTDDFAAEFEEDLNITQNTSEDDNMTEEFKFDDEKIAVDGNELSEIEEDFFPDDTDMPEVDSDIIDMGTSFDDKTTNISPLADTMSILGENGDITGSDSLDLDNIPIPEKTEEEIEDETIGLSSDELNNILETTEIIENDNLTRQDEPAEETEETTEFNDDETETIDLNSFDADLNISEENETSIIENEEIKQLSMTSSEEEEIYNSLKNEMSTAKKSEDDEKVVRLKDDVKNVLSYLDQLLDALPEEKIKEFAESNVFDTYRKLFEDLSIRSK